MNKHCDCQISTGIYGSLTFGTGELDSNGYWSVPCWDCAREHERRCPKDGPCWPFNRPKPREPKSENFSVIYRNSGDWDIFCNTKRRRYFKIRKGENEYCVYNEIERGMVLEFYSMESAMKYVCSHLMD